MTDYKPYAIQTIGSKSLQCGLSTVRQLKGRRESRNLAVCQSGEK